MQPILILIALLLLAYLAVRAGTLALTRTGLSRESASFQAQSAFMGVGFTTAESESVVSHPIRRRVVRALMMAGYAGIAVTVSAVAVGFRGHETNLLGLFGLLILGLGLVTVLWKIPWIRRTTDALIDPILCGIPALRVVDYEQLLQLDHGYAISEILVTEDHWARDRSLRKLRLADEGLVVLSIERASGGKLGTPPADTVVRAHDRLLLYGREEAARGLYDRSTGKDGDLERKRAIAVQQAVRVEETIEAERMEKMALEPSDAP